MSRPFRQNPIRDVVWGIVLVAATLFADISAIRDFVWIFRGVHLRDVEPWESGGILIITPWLLLVASRLMLGRYEHTDLLSPGALGALGVGLIGVAVIAYIKATIFDIDTLFTLTSLGVGAIGLGWYRWGEDHRRMPPNKRLEPTRRMIKE